MVDVRDYDFDVAVVMAAYNVEGFLHEAVDSVLRQTIGLDRIQLILVDDGSADSTGGLCAGFAERYPDNVVYVRQENAGVSAARNAGLAVARGAYVNFLDADDAWSADAFESALSFFSEHPEVGVAACRQEFFGAKEGPHYLSWKYAKTRVVSIEDDPSFIHLSVNNTFIAAPLLHGRSFDTRMAIGEDALLVNEILLEVGRYGVLAAGCYRYRKRERGASAMDRAGAGREYYFETPKLLYGRLADLSRERYGEVIPYIQHCVMYNLQWRLFERCSPPLGEDEKAEYRCVVEGLVEMVDDAIVASQKRFDFRKALYALAFKHGVAVREAVHALVADDGWVCIDFAAAGAGEGLARVRKLSALSRHVTVTKLSRTKEGVRLEGFIATLTADANDGVRVLFAVDGRDVAMSYGAVESSAVSTAFDGKVLPQRGFTADIPWDGRETMRVSATLDICGARREAVFDFKSYAGLNDSAMNSYLARDGATFRYRMIDGKRSTIIVGPTSFAGNLAYEHRLRKEMVVLPETADLVRWRKIGCRARRARSQGGKTLWLLHDRISRAGDNAEALFRYLHDHPIAGVEPVFAISATSPDFDRMKQYGRVVDFNSEEYKKLFLRADALVSSSADGPVINPFGSGRKWLSDLIACKFVFLQHGVIKDDLSDWLCKTSKDIALFVTSAPRERASILQGAYGYGEEEVLLSGLPRHDELLAEAASSAREGEKLVCIMPTWRKSLAGKVVEGSDNHEPLEGFEKTAFFRFYQALISDGRLNDALRTHGLRARFVLHPSLEQESFHFAGTDLVEVAKGCDYRRMFLDAAVVVTDYSSAVFDFALLRKPIVYAQFDNEEFYAGHLYSKGYFSYEEDGFGPVCDNLDSTVDAIVAALESGCEMAPEYRRRVDEFFFVPDRSRCEIVCDAVLGLKGGR